jgi:hypothetical protein
LQQAHCVFAEFELVGYDLRGVGRQPMLAE